MIKLKSIKVKFQIYLMLLILLVIIFANLLTQNITGSVVDRMVSDNQNQRGKDLETMLAIIRGRIFYFSLVLFVLAVIALMFIVKKITKPVDTIKKGLEKQVSERTKDLNAANEKLKEAVAEIKLTQKSTIQTETQKSLTSIVSGFGHEINNPLTGILGYIDLIELNDTLSPYSKKRLEGIKDQALRIKDIIDELNQLDPEIEQTKLEINLSNLLEKLTKILAKEEKNEGIVFETELAHEEVIVYGNHFSLWQVFEGIIENSIEAIKERNVEKGKIRVELKLDPGRDLAVTTVTDNGGGLENIDKAFNPFYTTKDRTQKRGIGLSIAFNLIREHKGDIIIANDKEGALVTVHLPFYQGTLHFQKSEGKKNSEMKIIK